jgi:hypothetical protein
MDSAEICAYSSMAKSAVAYIEYGGGSNLGT